MSLWELHHSSPRVDSLHCAGMLRKFSSGAPKAAKRLGIQLLPCATFDFRTTSIAAVQIFPPGRAEANVVTQRLLVRKRVPRSVNQVVIAYRTRCLTIAG